MSVGCVGEPDLSAITPRPLPFVRCIPPFPFVGPEFQEWPGISVYSYCLGESRCGLGLERTLLDRTASSLRNSGMSGWTGLARMLRREGPAGQCVVRDCIKILAG